MWLLGRIGREPGQYHRLHPDPVVASQTHIQTILTLKKDNSKGGGEKRLCEIQERKRYGACVVTVSVSVQGVAETLFIVSGSVGATALVGHGRSSTPAAPTA